MYLLYRRRFSGEGCLGFGGGDWNLTLGGGEGYLIGGSGVGDGSRAGDVLRFRLCGSSNGTGSPALVESKQMNTDGLCLSNRKYCDILSIQKSC